MATRKTAKAPATKAGAAKKTAATKAGAKKPATRKKAPAKSAAATERNIMYICRSCVWTEANREIDGKRQGKFLLDAVNELVDRKPLPKTVDLRGVFCLNGCKNPCNVSFRARDKFSLRFSHLTPDHATDVVAVAEAYAGSADGDLDDSEIPNALQGKVSVRTPPTPLPRRG